VTVIGNKNIQSRLDSVLNPKISHDGLSFLKCAFASPDFGVDPGKGIPDSYTGRTVPIKDCSTTALSFTANTDTYIVIAPIPGYAYFKAEVAPGVRPSIFTGVPFSTYATNFGANTVAGTVPPAMSLNNFTRFRYASLAAGLYPTSNYMSYAGSVSVWKADINLRTSQGNVMVTATDTIDRRGMFNSLEGFSAIAPLIPRDNYTESFIKGAYTMSLDRSGKFDWDDFMYSTLYADGDTNSNVFNSASSAMPLTGWGNMETIVFKVSTPTGAVNTANLKMWNCIEMQVNTSSSLYQFAGVSPALDPLALQAYGKIRNEIPVAVPCAQNSGFWTRVLSILRTGTSLLSHIPGPIGMISHGIAGLMS
jgi:hypothetical protein